MRSASVLFAALLLASCATPREASFYVNAIDTEEKPVTCVILKEDQVVLNDATNEPVRTPATIRVTFKQDRETGEFESVRLGVRAVEVGADGKIVRGLREGEESPYREDSRGIYPTDSRRQLFVLLKNK